MADQFQFHSMVVKEQLQHGSEGFVVEPYCVPEFIKNRTLAFLRILIVITIQFTTLIDS